MKVTANSETTKLHPHHDTSYRFLLSSKRLFVELLRSFVKRGWVDKVDENQVEEIPHTFILQDFRRQEADIVYRVTLDGQDVIFYLLLELQSSVDFRMPYRLLLYQVEIWRYLLKNDPTLFANRKSFQLPPIVPIVLYNGKKKWHAAKKFRSILTNEVLFGTELLDFEYLFIDVVRYTEAELIQLSNTIGAIFLLDQTEEVPLLLKRLQKITKMIQQLPADNQEKFISWLDHILKQKQPDSTINLDNIMKMEEGEVSMLRFEKALVNIEKQAIERGIEQGQLMVAKRMLELGMEAATIAAATGYSITEIEQLSNKK